MAIGIKALGGTGGTAVAYLLMLRFVIVVPITLVGLVLLVVRYGGIKKLRLARAAQETARMTGVADADRGSPVAAPPPPAPRARGHGSPTRTRASSSLWGALIAVGADRAPRSASATGRSTTTRARTRTSPTLPPDRRLRVQPAAARPAALLPDRADVRAVRRLGLHGAARPGADGRLAMVPLPLRAAPAARAAAARSWRRRCSRSSPTYLYFSALRPRGHLLRLAHAAR